MSMPRNWAFAVVVPLLLSLTGCGADRASQPDADGRNIMAAEATYQRAVQAMDVEAWDEAETLLRTALREDLYHGPAHNNLGVLLLEQGRLYEAAEEFDWARKLLPGHPEPRVNLAIALQRGGRGQEAFDTATGALEVRPGHLGAMQLRAWLARSDGIGYPEVRADLEAIAMRATDDTWQRWARLQLAALDTTP